jgi:peptide-methionine (R)-S-oxide reductase
MQDHMNRRLFLGVGVVAVAGFVLRRYTGSGSVAAMEKPAAPHDVTLIDFSDDGKRVGAVKVQTIVKSEEEWKTQLPKESFGVTRHADTEYPYSGKYWNQHDKGMYRCICCDTALFSSDTKFDSGTGWPSFWAPIAKENVAEINDGSLGMERTAVSCARCDAHLGHVFNDGPKPTGLRYCMNSVSLKFVKFA